MAGATLTFDDPEWAPVIDELIKKSHRTKFIEEQIKTNVKTARLKDYIERRAIVLKIDLNRPRGQKSKPESENFLQSPADQSHSAFLLGLHFGSTEQYSPNENVGNFSVLEILKSRLEIHNRYIRLYCERNEEPQISFEEYVLMLDAIKANIIKFIIHKECGTRIPIVASKTRYKCNICETNGENAMKSSLRLESLIAKSEEAARDVYSGPA